MDSRADNLNPLRELLDIDVTLSKAIETDRANNPNLVREAFDFTKALDALGKVALVKEAAARYPICIAETHMCLIKTILNRISMLSRTAVA
jgi:hypothetical protein